MFHLKIALSTGMLVAFSLGCLSAQVVEFDTSYIKLEIILDKNVLRFPEPVFGLVKITNTSNKREFFPAGLIEIYPHAIDGKNVELRSVLLNPPRLAKVEAGYSETKAFRYSIADKKQIRAILVDKSPLTFTFRTHGKPKNFPIEKLRYPDGIDYTEAGDFENLDSLPVTVHYSLEHLVFKDRIVGAFDNRIMKTLH